MNPQKNNMSVLAQISSWIPDRIADNLAKKYGIQTRSFGPFSHATAMMYAHLAHSLSLNDFCDDLHNHAGTLEQIRGCTPPSRNGLSYANRTPAHFRGLSQECASIHPVLGNNRDAVRFLCPHSPGAAKIAGFPYCLP